MRYQKFSIILTITVILVLVGGFCFVVNSVPPEGKGKKVSFEPVKVYDSSDPSQFVGILVGIYPAGYKPSAGYEVGAMFTVYVPEVGKFIELSRGGQVVESRFRLEYVYYSSGGCDSSGGTYAIPELDEVVDPAFISAHGFFDTSIGEYIWSFYKVGEQQTAWLESRHTGVIGACDDSLSGNYDAIPLTQVELPFNLPLQMPLTFQ